MSLVGPRPTVPAQVAVYNDFERRRPEAKPGISGWAQIHGRKAISWDERIRYDVWYVDHWGFWLDLYILLRTIPSCLPARGSTVPAASTATLCPAAQRPPLPPAPAAPVPQLRHPRPNAAAHPGPYARIPFRPGPPRPPRHPNAGAHAPLLSAVRRTGVRA